MSITLTHNHTTGAISRADWTTGNFTNPAAHEVQIIIGDVVTDRMKVDVNEAVLSIAGWFVENRVLKALGGFNNVYVATMAERQFNVFETNNESLVLTNHFGIGVGSHFQSQHSSLHVMNSVKRLLGWLNSNNPESPKKLTVNYSPLSNSPVYEVTAPGSGNIGISTSLYQGTDGVLGDHIGHQLATNKNDIIGTVAKYASVNVSFSMTNLRKLAEAHLGGHVGLGIIHNITPGEGGEISFSFYKDENGAGELDLLWYKEDFSGLGYLVRHPKFDLDAEYDVELAFVAGTKTVSLKIGLAGDSESIIDDSWVVNEITWSGDVRFRPLILREGSPANNELVPFIYNLVIT